MNTYKTSISPSHEISELNFEEIDSVDGGGLLFGTALFIGSPALGVAYLAGYALGRME